MPGDRLGESIHPSKVRRGRPKPAPSASARSGNPGAEGGTGRSFREAIGLTAKGTGRNLRWFCPRRTLDAEPETGLRRR